MKKENFSRILLVRLSAIGDVVQTLPLLPLIKEKNPDIVIGWLVEADAQEILAGNSMIDYLHVSYRKRWLRSLKNPLNWPKTYREIRQFIKEIKEIRYDVVFDLQGLLKSAFTAFLTGISQRIGFSCAREMGHIFYTKKISLPDGTSFFDPETEVIRHFTRLVEAGLGCPLLGRLSYPLSAVGEEQKESIEKMLSELGNSNPIVAFAPATNWESKHWPPMHWTELIKKVLELSEYNIVLVGGKGDSDLIESIVAPLSMSGRVLDLSGKTSLKELQALFEKTEVVVALDSAPLHLAGAVGKARLIGIYGSTSPRRTPPPQVEGIDTILISAKLACQPCHSKVCPLKTTECMTAITSEQVTTAILRKEDKKPVTDYRFVSTQENLKSADLNI